MTRYRLITLLAALVWLVNGLYCKVLALVPRHREIVGEILGDEYARILTVLIGLAEIVMAVWIVSAYRRRLAVTLQIIVIAVMNTLETLLVPDLLLWGYWNAIFAGCFVGLLYLNEFVWGKSRSVTSPMTTLRLR